MFLFENESNANDCEKINMSYHTQSTRRAVVSASMNYFPSSDQHQILSKCS